MSRKKMQERKKQARKQKAKDKVLTKRTAIRAEAKKEREAKKQQIRVKKLKRKLKRMDDYAEEILEQLPSDVLEQLEHNCKILDALEEEYDSEIEAKRNINEKLEEEGFLTVDEKLRAIQDQQLSPEYMEAARALDEQQKIGVAGSADCKMKANPKKRSNKEVADVGVVKAKAIDLIKVKDGRKGR